MEVEQNMWPPRMSGMEAAMWRGEDNPRYRQSLTALFLLDRAPEWDRLVHVMDRASRQIPRLRQRVIETPLQLAFPSWVDDPDFDLSFHLRRLRVPAPGSIRELLDLAEPLACEDFDRARPLWRATLVEGVGDDGAALVIKLHHVIADGLGALQLSRHVFDHERDGDADRPMASLGKPQRVTEIDLLQRSLRPDPGALIRRVGRGVRACYRASARPGHSVELVLSLTRQLRPVPANPSPVLRHRSLTWHFDVLDVPLDDLKQAGKAAGGTVNDAYLAALCAGFRRYHAHFGSPIPTIPLAIPISRRTSDDEYGGNRFGLSRMAAPVAELDPARRIDLIHRLVADARAEAVPDVITPLGGVLYRMPTWMTGPLQSSMRMDLAASNVPATPFPVYVAGAEVTGGYAFPPLAGAAVIVILMSYNGRCFMGINSDAAAVTDREVFLGCLRAGFDEVLTLAAARASLPNAADPRTAKPGTGRPLASAALS